MKLFNIFKKNKEVNNIEVEGKSLISYSKFFKRYIVLDEYIDDDNWYFYLSDAHGNKHYNRLKGGSKFNEFKWSSVKNDKQR